MPWSSLVRPEWTLIPLRIPGGWVIHHNGVDARLLADGRIEVNDSEDLLWVSTLRGRELHLDLGWYRECFRLVLLAPDWDNVARSFETTDLHEIVCTLEAWLLRPEGGAS